ncbi:MAG: 6-phosphogluconolactonase [Armatimonadota bacterium]
MNTEFVICDSADDVTRKASELIQSLCSSALTARSSASLAVSGGSTPQALFKLWQTETFPNLESVHVFMSDDRLVLTSSTDSNAGTMLRQWPDVHKSQLHLPDFNLQEPEIAIQYQQTLVETLGEQPVFDCIMLGLGEDGHTASLFPGQGSLSDQNLVCVADHGSLPPPVKRLTFTYRCINMADNVVVIATGQKKRKWIDAVLAGVVDTWAFPLSGVRPKGKLWFILDQAAWPKA